MSYTKTPASYPILFYPILSYPILSYGNATASTGFSNSRIITTKKIFLKMVVVPFWLMAITPSFRAYAHSPSFFPEDYFSQNTFMKNMILDEAPSYPLEWEETAESSYLIKPENFYLNEEDEHLLLALNPADATEAGSTCNEQRCYPYNPFRETVLTVEHLQNINMCKQTLELPACKKLGEQKPKDLKNCEDPLDLNGSSGSVSGTYVMGCMLGVKSFAEGMWEFAKMVGRGAVGAVKMPFSPSAREKWQRDYNAKFMPAKEKFIAFVKQAFRKEYNKHRRNFPVGSVGDMGASIQVAHLYFPKLWEKVMGVVEEQTEKLQCMNEGAKMRVGCMVLAEAGFEVAPAILTGGGTLALAMVMRAKKGERLAEVFDVPGGGGKRAVSGNLTDRERIAEAGRLLNRKLTVDQERALLEAHLVGKGARGADGGPARLGNYTQAQIVRKGKILRRAGFTPDETRKLMDEGVVGIMDALSPFHAVTDPVEHSFYESAGFYDSPIDSSVRRANRRRREIRRRAQARREAANAQWIEEYTNNYKADLSTGQRYDAGISSDLKELKKLAGESPPPYLRNTIESITRRKQKLNRKLEESNSLLGENLDVSSSMSDTVERLNKLDNQKRKLLSDIRALDFEVSKKLEELKQSPDPTKPRGPFVKTPEELSRSFERERAMRQMYKTESEVKSLGFSIAKHQSHMFEINSLNRQAASNMEKLKDLAKTDSSLSGDLKRLDIELDHVTSMEQVEKRAFTQAMNNLNKFANMELNAETMKQSGDIIEYITKTKGDNLKNDSFIYRRYSSMIDSLEKEQLQLRKKAIRLNARIDTLLRNSERKRKKTS